jgi:hypothetical protein
LARDALQNPRVAAAHGGGSLGKVSSFFFFFSLFVFFSLFLFPFL